MGSGASSQKSKRALKSRYPPKVSDALVEKKPETGAPEIEQPLLQPATPHESAVTHDPTSQILTKHKEFDTRTPSLVTLISQTVVVDPASKLKVATTEKGDDEEEQEVKACPNDNFCDWKTAETDDGSTFRSEVHEEEQQVLRELRSEGLLSNVRDSRMLKNEGQEILAQLQAAGLVKSDTQSATTVKLPARLCAIPPPTESNTNSKDKKSKAPAMEKKEDSAKLNAKMDKVTQRFELLSNK